MHYTFTNTVHCCLLGCSTMGADQFDLKYSQDKKEAGQFFSYFYWSINLGALCAYTLIAYICQYGLPFAGGER